MRKRLTSVKATQYRDIDVQGGIRKTSEDRIIEYIEYSEQINELIDKLIKLKMTAVERIENIDDGLYRTLLTERYVNNKSWEDVAGLIGYSERRTMEHHNDALREYEKVNKVRSESHCNAVKNWVIVKMHKVQTSRTYLVRKARQHLIPLLIATFSFSQKSLALILQSLQRLSTMRTSVGHTTHVQRRIY